MKLARLISLSLCSFLYPSLVFADALGKVTVAVGTFHKNDVMYSTTQGRGASKPVLWLQSPAAGGALSMAPGKVDSVSPAVSARLTAVADAASGSAWAGGVESSLFTSTATFSGYPTYVLTVTATGDSLNPCSAGDPCYVKYVDGGPGQNCPDGSDPTAYPSTLSNITSQGGSVSSGNLGSSHYWFCTLVYRQTSGSADSRPRGIVPRSN